MTDSIFLSASVPLQDRDPQYFKTADVVAIKESIVGLIGAIYPAKQIVFGGHPAITPLIDELAAASGNSKNIRIYQSDFFKNESQRSKVLTYISVPAVENNRELSLAKMRHEMISGQDFKAAVFIGGMEGVEEEFRLFHQFHSSKPCYPIASTGAAALKIYQENNDLQRPDLLNELQYLTLFQRLLN